MYLSIWGLIILFLSIANCSRHQHARTINETMDFENLKDTHYTTNFIRHSNYQLSLYGKDYRMENPLHNAKCRIDLVDGGFITYLENGIQSRKILCMARDRVVKLVKIGTPSGYECYWLRDAGRLRLLVNKKLCLTRKGPTLYMKECNKLPADEWTFIKTTD